MLVYDLQNLVKVYPKQNTPANNNISLQIEQGEIFGLLGDNGAGKSTLVKQWSGYYDKHQVLSNYLDNILPSLTLGYMPQDGRAFNNLTVAEALYFTAQLRSSSLPTPTLNRLLMTLEQTAL